MNKLLLNIYRVFVPKPLRTAIARKNIRNKILKYFAGLHDREINAEQREVIKYLESNPLSIFPYPFDHNYQPESVEVMFDNLLKMHYVIFEGKKLYFKKRWSRKRIQKCFSDLQREQDINSPHRYLDGDFSVNESDVIGDIGTAEGNFSLSVVEKVRKIYIFEYDREWSEALRATFAPWKDKVEIINKRVSETDDSRNIRFDTFLNGRENVTFLKIDVDGAEQKVLNSSKTILGGNLPLKIALCTYHRNNDEKDFTALLNGYGFEVATSKGYMIQFYDKQIKAPYLRRGLIRATRF